MRSLLAIVAAALATTAWGLTIPPVPLSVQQSAPPLVMLVSGKDHRLFYEAYNDASDIDGDGTLDVRFKPGITYLGLFDPKYCYTYGGGTENDGLFTPANATADGRCTGQWSGNWLNYVTTSRIDALRVVLYGGMRDRDTATETILRRAYIPQDAHSWAKEYTSRAVDGYLISDYTPVAQPEEGKRHFFGNVTRTNGIDCSVLATCSKLPPWLSVVENSTSRVWDWASSEAPVLADVQRLKEVKTPQRKNYTVRVAVCTNGSTQGCKRYPNGNYKPIGLLHDYGETGAMQFGLLTGSYDNSMAGGRLRKVVSSFTDEVNPQTGQFTGVNGIVRSYDALRIRDYNNGTTLNKYRSPVLTDRGPRPGEFPDWGNPVGEMMYESLRYFAGKRQPTAEYAGGGRAMDDAVGLPAPAWDDPFDKTNSAAKAPLCARASMLVVSDVNVSYDSDQLPGSYFGPGLAGDLPGLDVQAEAQRITAMEPDALGPHFIGQSGGLADRAPTAKLVGSLGTVRGLAPEEPTKEGSYYAASVASYGKRTDLRTDLKGRQSVDTFVVALASPLPRITVPLSGGRTVSLVPFAKSIYGLGDNKINPAKGQYQPTNQIVDFYVESVANSGAGDRDLDVNGGRYQARFQIAFEDVEQGSDHDMDVMVEYTVTANADDTVTVTVRPIKQAGLILHRIGYVISGTDADGVYLEVQDELPLVDNKPFDVPYFLDTPKGRKPGFCDANLTHTECQRLPYAKSEANAPNDPVGYIATRTFRPGTRSGATLLKDPLWYAAKWGGFVDGNENDKPDQRAEWDLDGDGQPDNYALVLQPAKLRQALRNTLDSILRRASSASNVAINSTAINANAMVYQATFNAKDWSGDLLAYPVTTRGVASAPDWSASMAGPPWSERRIFMRDATSSTRRLETLGALPAADQEALRKSADIVDYLRGDTTKHLRNGGALRNRAGVLGDIAHSSPVHEPTENVLYVGGNDGMLHAFDALDRGRELFAFIPRQSVSRLARLSDPSYSHDYFVDGDIVVAPRSALTGERQYLFALLGRGGKGLFSLDVTQPRAFGAAHFRWEYTPEGSTAAKADPDLGLMLGRPVVTRLNNGKLGVIAGNGYDSSSKKAVLYVFSIATDGSLDAVHKLVADPTTGNASGAATADNGLAGPAIVDEDNNGTADLVFAGDLLGNVWRFDLKAANPQAWKVEHGNRPLFTARSPAGVAQPITANMHVARKPPAPTGTDDPHAGKYFAFFGTGAYFRAEDPRDTAVQSWWGIRADLATPIVGRNALKQRTIAQVGTTARNAAARSFSPASGADMKQSSGWFVDFTEPVAGERIVTESRVVDLVVPVLLAASMYPVTDDPCIPGGRGFLNVLDPFTGAGLEAGVIDANRDGSVDDDRLGTRFIGSIDLDVGVPTQPQLMRRPDGGATILVGGSGDSTGTQGPSIGQVDTGPGAPKTLKFKGRLAWREVVKE